VGNMVEVKVPDIGDFKDVEVIELLVHPGDRIKPEQSLITVESDKASMEIPSPMAGVVREVKVKLGDKVSQGSPILELEPAASAEASATKVAEAPATAAKAAIATPPAAGAPTAKPPAGSPAVAAAQAAAQAGSPPSTEFATEMGARPDIEQLAQATSPRAHASPSVRRFARELGVDLARVKGSGPKGRICRTTCAPS